MRAPRTVCEFACRIEPCPLALCTGAGCVCGAGSVVGLPWVHRTSRDSQRNNAKQLADYLSSRHGADGYLLFNLWYMSFLSAPPPSVLCCQLLCLSHAVCVCVRACVSSFSTDPALYDCFRHQVCVVASLPKPSVGVVACWEFVLGRRVGAGEESRVVSGNWMGGVVWWRSWW